MIHKNKTIIFRHISQSILILIEPQQTSLCIQSFQYLPGMSSPPEGQIQIHTSLPDIQSIDRLFQQNRYMIFGHIYRILVFKNFFRHHP